MRFFKIEEQEIGIVSAEGNVLWSCGVSTCLCILIRGTIDDKPYLTMFHWNGLPKGFDKHSPLLTSLLEITVCNIFKAMASKIKAHMDSRKKPVLSLCFCIGGQKATENLSGTEVEVEAINMYARRACDQYFRVMSDAIFSKKNFLTADSESLRVVFSEDKVTYCDDREPFVNEITQEPIDEDAPSDSRVAYYMADL